MTPEQIAELEHKLAELVIEFIESHESEWAKLAMMDKGRELIRARAK